MYYTSKLTEYEYTDGQSKLVFDSMEIKRGVKLSEYPVLANKVEYAITGTTPRTITLKGRFLPDDFAYVYNYMAINVGRVISSITVNEKQFNSVVILNADAVLKNSSFLGEMSMVIQTV